MNKLTPEERIKNKHRVLFNSQFTMERVKMLMCEHAAQEIAEAKNKMWTDGGNVIITFDEYNLLKKEVAEKDAQLEKAVKLLQKAYQKVNAKNRADRGAISIEIHHFLTELKQGQ